MSIEQFMRGVVGAIIITVVLVLVCIAWICVIVLTGSVALVSTLASGVTEVLVYIHQRIRLITRGQK